MNTSLLLVALVVGAKVLVLPLAAVVVVQADF